LITIPDDGSLSGARINKDKGKLIPGTRHRYYPIYSYPLPLQTVPRVVSKRIISNLSQVTGLKPQTLAGNHGSGCLATTLLTKIKHLQLAVKLGKMRNNTEVIYSIQAETCHIVCLIKR
jgi:hypothetical protein